MGEEEIMKWTQQKKSKADGDGERRTGGERKRDKQRTRTGGDAEE